MIVTGNELQSTNWSDQNWIWIMDSTYYLHNWVKEFLDIPKATFCVSKISFVQTLI